MVMKGVIQVSFTKVTRWTPLYLSKFRGLYGTPKIVWVPRGLSIFWQVIVCPRRREILCGGVLVMEKGKSYEVRNSVFMCYYGYIMICPSSNLRLRYLQRCLGLRFRKTLRSGNHSPLIERGCLHLIFQEARGLTSHIYLGFW